MNASVVAHAKPYVQAPSCSTPTCLTVTGSWHAPAHGDQGLLFAAGAAVSWGKRYQPIWEWSINCVT